MKSIITLIIAAVLVLGGLRLFHRKLLYFPVPLDPGQAVRLAEPDRRLTEISLDREGGVVLRGWVIEKDMDNLPLIFYFGGNAEEVSWNIDDFLARVNANLVLVNYRGYGQSGGRPEEEDLKADALALFDHMAETRGVPPERCGAWGRSLGSSMAAWLVWKRNLGRLILTCPFDSIEAVAAGFYPAWLVGLVLTDTHRTIDFAGQIKAPALVLAADRDEIIAPERTRTLYEGLAGPKQMVLIQGAGHNTIFHEKAYVKSKFVHELSFFLIQRVSTVTLPSALVSGAAICPGAC